jgi:hypothetical protein
VAIIVGIAGLGLPVTGIVNHFLAMSPLTVGHHAWMSAHNVLGILFVVFSLWHVVLNRRALWLHVKSGRDRIPAFSREAVLAGTVVAVTLLVFVGHAFHAGQ